MKRNRGWRREQNERVVDNRIDYLKKVERSPERVKYFEDKKNKLAVKHPCDCGKTDCGCCHPQKRKGCESKNKDEHVLLEIQIAKELNEELRDDMCDFGD